MRPLIEAFPIGLINLPSTEARPVTSPNIPGAPAGRAIRSHPSVSTPSLSTKASFWASKPAGLFQMFPQLLTEVNWLSLGHFRLPCHLRHDEFKQTYHRQPKPCAATPSPPCWNPCHQRGVLIADEHAAITTWWGEPTDRTISAFIALMISCTEFSPFSAGLRLLA